MSNCVYTIDGKKYSLPEFKAFLAEGGLERLYPDGGYSWLEKSKEKKLPTAKEAHDFVVSHIQAAKTDDYKEAYSSAKQENRFASMDEALNDAEKELRKLSKQQETEGDVLLGNGKYVAFDDALRIAKEGIESGALRPAPFQLHDRLDISMRDVDRILAAVNTQKYSKGQSTGSTVAEITSLLPKRVKAMLDSGKLKVVQSHANSQVEGYTDGDTIVLVADRLNVDNLNSVLSHELIHYGLSNDPKLKAAYDRFQGHLQARFNAAAKGHGTKADKDAYNRVMAANTPAKDRIEEFGAYLVSQYQTNPQSLSESLKKAIRDFIAAIRAFLLRNGLDGGYIKSLTPADLAALSKYGSRPLRGNARNGDGVMASAKPIPETLTIDGKERSTRNSNGQLIAQTEEGIRNFWLWFGDSRVTDASGRPLVVYHGTGSDFTQFNTFSSWFSYSPSFANEYAGLRDSQRPGSSSVMANYVNATNSFDADKLPKTVTIQQFFSEILKQSGLQDKKKIDELKGYLDAARKGAREEESGPHYSNWDFWHRPRDFFGENGEKAMKNAFIVAGFDSIDFTEDGEKTIGVFSSVQVKSATGNAGAFSQDNPDIRYSTAPDQKSPLWKRWFGNSKMVSGGQPIRFYHGSNADFTVFDKSKLGTNTTHTTAGLGHFFTRNRDEAARYGEKVHEVFLSIEKPYVVTSDLLNERMGKDAATFAEKLKSQGYDGIYIKDAGYAIAFNSNQAKLTSNNAPSFGEDIRYSKSASDFDNIMESGKKFVNEIEKLSEQYGTVYIRWSPSALDDLSSNHNSRDFVSGENHNGLSAVEIASKTHSIDVAKSLSEYMFLRIQNKNNIPHVYIGDRVGTDSDSNALIKPTKLLLSADKEVLKSIDLGLSKIIELEYDIKDLKSRLNNVTDKYGKEIIAEKLKVKEIELSNLISDNDKSSVTDIRYSMAMPEDTVNDIAGIEYSTAQNLLKKFKRMTGKGRISARQIGLSALTQGQLVEVGKEILPMLQRFAVMRNHYDTTESFWHKQGDDIAQRWERLAPNYKPMSAAWKSRNRLEQRRLADMMHDMTVFGIDPRIPMGKNTVPEGWTLADLRETYNDLKSRYDQLLPATKTLLDNAEKFHMDVSNELVNSLIDKINDGNLPEDVQMSLAAKIKAQFKQQQGPYFPLMRFGSYWVDHAQGVNFFETKSEQDDFIANLKDDGVTVNGSGKSLKNFNTVEGVDAGFIQDVDALIDKLDIEQASELKDEIFQLYLARLPENSMRKRFIHRKKTPGYEQDALRSFSKKAFHDGKQLAKVKYAPELRKVLADAKEIMEVGNSGKQYGKVERKIKVIPDILDQLENGVEFSKILTKYEKDVDWLRQFNRYKNQDELEKALGDYLNRQQDLLKQADDYNAHDAAETTADILDALQTSYNNMMQSNTSPVANLINQSVFTWFLGFNPSSALINLLQTPGVSMPVLGGRHGMDKAGLQMARAYKDFFGNKFTIEPALKNKGEAAMFDALTKNGTFDRTRSHDLAGLSEEGVTRGTFMRDFMSMSTAMFHYAEVANREITALAAYRLEYAKTQDVEKSIQYANDVVKQTHLDYSSANRPDLFQGNAARVMLQFKMYSQGMTYLWGKQLYDAFKSQSSERKAEARRTILAMIGVQTSIAGVLGLPIGGLLMAASMLMGMMDDDDDPKDPETEIRKALNDWLGSDLGRIVSHGVASETGIDFASRLSLADLWIREPDRELEGKDAATYILETVVGPIGGIINNITTGLKTMRDGNVERGAEKLLPSFAAAPMKAIRMIEDGGATSMAGNMIYETNAYEKALQALGFRASGARERFDQNSAIMNRKMAITTTKSRLVAKAARAQMQGDKAALSEVMKDIEGFNQRNPDYRITPKTISASIKHRTTNSRKAENGLVFDRRMKRIAEEEDFLN